MAKVYTKGSTVVDEVLSGAERYDIKDNGGTPIESNVQINLATSVAVAGTTINAARLNNIETGIDTLDTKVADANDLLTTGGTTTAYTLTTTGAAALATGERFRVKFNATAGATPTLNRDSKGAKSLKYYDSTGTKQSCGATNIIANLITDIVYDGTDYVVIDPAGVSGGSSMTNSNISPTTANVTASVNTRYFADISGLTADRNFVLPAGAVGDEISINISVGDDTYELVIIGNTGITINGGAGATEWSRLFITGESVRLIATSTANWFIISDGRLPSMATFERITSAANTTHSADTDTKADWNSIPLNIGTCADTTNDRFIARRAGIYECSGGYAPVSAITDQKFVNVKVLKNGSTKIVSASQRQSAATSSSIVGASINPKPVSLAVGDYLEYFFNTEEANKGLLNTDYAGAGSNQLGAVSFFAVKEILR